MKKIINYCLFFCTSFYFISCSTKTSFQEVLYKDLPQDVKKKFVEIYNYKEDPKIDKNGKIIEYYSPPFAECYDLNLNCNCKLESEPNLLGVPNFVIESCNKEIKISWAVYQRVFVIKNDSIYYPWANNGMTSTGEARSYDIKIDTLKFRIEKMNSRAPSIAPSNGYKE